MDNALGWLLAMLIVIIAGSFFVPGHRNNDSFWSSPSNYRLNGYKYLNREI